MRYQKVLIVTSPVMEIIRPPEVLAILAACCEKVETDYDIFDLNLHLHKSLSAEDARALTIDLENHEFSKQEHSIWYDQICQGLIDKINEYNPDLVAISMFTYQSVMATDQLLSKLVNRKYHIVVGGFGAANSYTKSNVNYTSFGKYCIDHKLADHHVIGEGELSFINLLNGNINSPGINGIPPEQITDLNALPTPSYKKINPNDYLYPFFPSVSLNGSRGCVRDCSFCDVRFFWKKYIYRSGESLANDMYKIFCETGINSFTFSDSLINGSLSNFREFNTKLIELRQKDSKFQPLYSGQFIIRQVGTVKDSDYELMKEAGAERLMVGIEHFSENVRNHMNKNFDNEALEWHFAKCGELGIHNMILMITGYPTETLQDHHNNLEYFHKFQKYALSRVIVSLNLYIHGLLILEGSPLRNDHSILLQDTDDPINWVNLNNLSLTPIERYRRTAELLLTAVKLGYSVWHIRQKIDQLKRVVEKQLKNTNVYSKPFVPFTYKEKN